MRSTQFYKSLQIASWNGRTHIVSVVNGRLSESLYSVDNNFAPPDLSRVAYFLKRGQLDWAKKALANEPTSIIVSNDVDSTLYMLLNS